MKRLNYYDVETITVCPYCMSPIQTDPHMGCCGEVHSDEVYQDSQGEIYTFDEVELYRPILDVIRYEILSKHTWRIRLNRWKRVAKDRFKTLYDGTYPNESFIRKVRRLTGFQWTNLDRIVLERLYGSHTIWCYSPDQLIQIRKDSVKRMRNAWAKGELLGCNLYPPIRDGE